MPKIISKDSHNHFYTVRVEADSLNDAERHIDRIYHDAYHEAVILSSVSIVNLPNVYEIKFKMVRPG